MGMADSDDAQKILNKITKMALTEAADMLRTDWTEWSAAHPDDATPDVRRGYLLAVRRLDGLALHIKE